MFCSDDKHPDDLMIGHVNLLVKRALANGIDIFGLNDCPPAPPTWIDKTETVESWTNGISSWIEFPATWSYKQKLAALMKFEHDLDIMHDVLKNQKMWKNIYQ